MRTFDDKYLCNHFLRFENTHFNTDCPSLDERVRWCYENIPEERLWYYEHEPYKYGSTRKINGFPERWTLIFFFEIEEDAMAFKMVWC